MGLGIMGLGIIGTIGTRGKEIGLSPYDKKKKVTLPKEVKQSALTLTAVVPPSP